MYHVGHLMAKLMDYHVGHLMAKLMDVSRGTTDGQGNGCITWDT